LGGGYETLLRPGGLPEGQCFADVVTFTKASRTRDHRAVRADRSGSENYFIARPLGAAVQPVKNGISQIIGNTVLAEAVG